MTDPPPETNSHIAPAAPSNTEVALPSSTSHLSLHNAPLADKQEEKIKCICGFEQDDGLSVFCEKCETWQHTICYYYDEKNDRPRENHELAAISHSCTDCDPRWVDVQAAINRQRRQFGAIETDDKKVKKIAPKSHKKKTRGTENGVLTNGWSPTADATQDRTSRSPRDQPTSTKRLKANHRASQSLALSQNPILQPHKRSASSIQSPTKHTNKKVLNGFVKEHFSDEFLQLYDDDVGEQDMQTNVFNNLDVTHDLSTWAVDVEALEDATRGFSHIDVFHRIDQPCSDITNPLPQKRIKEDVNIMKSGRCPRWVYLTSNGPTMQGSVVGELKGKIGYMKEYISDPENRWDWLRHPAPFVFFHPKLPIYVDTRAQGTICRYLRRSCRPNVSMMTFLGNGNEYHFCFTAKQDIEDGAELTIGWTLDEHMRKIISNKSDMAKDLSPEGEDYITDWVGKVSSEFGGCACGMPDSCWFVRYDPENKASVRSKAGHSRRRQPTHVQDTSDAEDAASTSRSNSGSRDLTPTGSSTNGPALGLEISDREKRKIAALEKNLDGDKHQPATKRKKRNSGGSSANAAGSGISKHWGHTTSVSQPNTPRLAHKSQYVDVGSGRKSGSPAAKVPGAFVPPRNNGMNLKKAWSQPNTPTTSSPLAKSNYVDSAVQVDMEDDNDWYRASSIPNRSRKPYMSLTKRLLLRSQQDRQRIEERRRSSEALIGQEPASNVVETPSPGIKTDVDMQDAPFDLQRSQQGAVPEHSGSPPPANLGPPPWPSQRSLTETNGTRPPNLLVQFPSKISHPPDSTSSTPLTQTPVSTLPPPPIPSHPPLHPPSSAGALQPSPAKKKVSLSDYMKRKASTTEPKHGAISPELQHGSIQKPPLSASTSDGAMEGSAILDTPKKEETNPMEVVTGRTRPVSPVPEQPKTES